METQEAGELRKPSRSPILCCHSLPKSLSLKCKHALHSWHVHKRANTAYMHPDMHTETQKHTESEPAAILKHSDV